MRVNCLKLNVTECLNKKGSLTHNRCYRISKWKGDQIMSPRSKKEYIETIFLRYKKASPKEKILVLNEFCATCGFHRKLAIRVLRKFKRLTQPQPKKRGRTRWISQCFLFKAISFYHILINKYSFWMKSNNIKFRTDKMPSTL